MSDRRTELEKAGSGLHWELLRQAHFTKLGNTCKSEECRLLADIWRQRRDALWADAQGAGS